MTVLDHYQNFAIFRQFYLLGEYIFVSQKVDIHTDLKKKNIKIDCVTE